MFEETFKDALFHIIPGNSLTGKLWREIQESYNTRLRYYHNITHLDNLADQLLPARNQIEDWQTLIFSVAYHDIIYNVFRKDNEEKSAALAFDRLTQLNRSIIQKEKCKMQILATKQHHLSKFSDTNFLIDADLSVLGFNSNAYATYAEQVRKEYAHIPTRVYNAGRRKVLAGFLKMEPIYKTKYFRDKYEEQAKINLSNEFKTLS